MLQVCKIQRKSFFKTLKEVVIFVCKFGMDGLVSWRRSNHIRITEQLWSHSFQHFWKELWTKRWTCTHTIFWEKKTRFKHYVEKHMHSTMLNCFLPFRRNYCCSIASTRSPWPSPSLLMKAIKVQLELEKGKVALLTLTWWFHFLQVRLFIT